MKRINRWITNQKLQVKILVIVIGASIVLAVGYGTIWQIVSAAYHNYNYEQNAQILAAYSKQIENKFRKLNTITLSILGDTNIQKNLSEYMELENMSEDWLDVRSKLNRQLTNHISSTEDFISFGIYLSAARPIGTKVDLSDEESELLIEKALEAKGGMEIVVYQNRIFMVRQIREIVTFENLGIMIGELDVEGMLRENKKQYQEFGIDLNVSLFVDDECIYYDDEDFAVMKNDGWVIKNGYFITQSTSKNGWIYLLYTPYDAILRSVQKSNTQASLLMLALTVCVVSLCWYLLSLSMKRLGDLVQQFDAYGKGILPDPEEMGKYEDRKDEIGYLYRQFGQMVLEHKHLEEENYNKMLLDKEAQYKQLQKQIQPHFIFNTLSLIAWMAYQHDDTEIAELTNSLSQLIKGSMHFSEDRISVREEVKLIAQYINIQRFRYGKRIDFSENIPLEMHKVEIPQMTLLPLVENAITHALEEMIDTCVINVSGRVEEDTAVFVVEDNGEGIEEDIIEKLASGERQAKGNGIGLLNVHRRIQIAFGEKYGLFFRRENDKTQVYVKVPLGAKG